MYIFLWLLPLIALGSLVVGGAAAVRMNDQKKRDSQLVTFRLHLPRNLDYAQVSAFIRSLAGIRPAWPLQGLPTVVFETLADHSEIAYYLSAPKNLSGFVMSQLRVSLPGVHLEEAVPLPPHWTIAHEVGLKGSKYPLRVDYPETVSASILANLDCLEEGEGVLLQWVTAPAVPQHMPPLVHKTTRVRTPFSFSRDYSIEPDLVKAQREKLSDHNFLAVGRLAVRSPTRAGQLMNQLEGSLRSVRRPGMTWYRRPLTTGACIDRIARRSAVLAFPCVLNLGELAALVAYPIGSPALAALDYAGLKLAPADYIPREGRIVAISNVITQRSLAIDRTDALKHMHVIGPTGVGKSTFLHNLIAQDIAVGFGVCVIDPKGDLVEAVADSIPESRIGDVIWLDPTDDERPVGFNVLAGGDPYLVTDQLMEVFDKLYSLYDRLPRGADILRSALLTLAFNKLTISDIPELLTNTGFRARLTGALKDPTLDKIWTWYDNLSDVESVVAPLLRRLRPFELQPSLRACFGQDESTFRMDEVISRNKILLVNLSKGRLGEGVSSLVGALVVAKLWQAVQARDAIPANRRRPFFGYFDEFQDYLKLPLSFADILAQARGLGFGLTLAHQHLGQLKGADLRQDVLTNARSKIVFQTSAGDASALGKEVGVDPGDLQRLGKFEVVAQLVCGDRVAPPATGQTLPPPTPMGLADLARETSRAVYGEDQAVVEARFIKRHQARPGSRRRPSIGVEDE
jgi:Type IV secretion-system coupling protein DNA-binding domain